MSAHNGQPAPTVREQLREARAAVRLEEAQLELTRLRTARRLVEHSTGRPLLEGAYDGYTGYAFGDVVDPMDAFRDADLQRGYPIVDRGYLRKDGYNRPFLWNDLDLDLARSISRWICTKNKLAIGALTTLRNFAIKQGMKYDVEPKAGCTEKAAPALAAHLNLMLTETHLQNDWPNREASSFWRAYRDGETGLRHFPQPSGLTWVRFVEPETVRQPLGSPETYSWGILTDDEDIERRLEYAVHRAGPDDPEYVREDCEDLPMGTESSITWLKRNTDECVKRGLPDLYCVGSDLDGVNKLLRNMTVSGGVQAAIAWIEKFTAATGATVQDQIANRRDQNRPNNAQPITGQTPNYTKYEPGTIPKVGAGKDYIPPPIPVGASIHIQIAQAVLRAVGVRWCMPEFMISGDASNANFASTLVSGSPFVNFIECEQGLGFKPYFLRAQWIAVRNWCRAGKCLVAGHCWSYEEVRALVDIHATPPQVAIANKGEEATVDQGDMDRGVLSVQERQRKLGLDPHKMTQEIQEQPPKKPATPGNGAGGGGANGAPSPFGGVSNGLGGLFGESLEDRLATLRERYGTAAATRILNGAARLLEDTQDSLGRWHDAKGHLITHGGGGGKPAGDHPLDAHARELAQTPAGRRVLHKGRQLAAHVAGHIKGAVSTGVKKAIDALDEEAKNGPSLIIGGIKSRSPAAIAHGVAQLVSLVYENVHQEVYETAMADHSIPGAHLVGKMAGKALAGGEKALLRAVAWSMAKGKKALGLAEAIAGEPSDELSHIDAALVRAAAEAALGSLTELYRQVGLSAEALPSVEDMEGRLAKTLRSRVPARESRETPPVRTSAPPARTVRRRKVLRDARGLVEGWEDREELLESVLPMRMPYQQAPYRFEPARRAAAEADASIPVQELDPTQLVATQPDLSAEKLAAITGPLRLDRPALIVRQGGKLYIEDGHHRAVHALTMGQRLPARVIEVRPDGTYRPAGV